MRIVRNAAFLFLCICALTTPVLASDDCGEEWPWYCDCDYEDNGVEVWCHTVPNCEEAMPNFCDHLESRCVVYCGGEPEDTYCSTGGVNCSGTCVCNYSAS